MRIALLSVLVHFIAAEAGCDSTECFCDRGFIQAEPARDQVLAVTQAGYLTLTASSYPPGITAIMLESTPPRAFRLDLQGARNPSKPFPLFLEPDEPLTILVRLSSEHPLSEPADAELSITLDDGQAIKRRFRLEPPTEHLEFYHYPLEVDCLDAGQTGTHEIEIANRGSADGVIALIQVGEANPGFSLRVAGREYPLIGSTTLTPPIAIVPGSSLPAAVLYTSSGAEPAEIDFGFNGTEPGIYFPLGGIHIRFNASCPADIDAPQFDDTAVGESSAGTLLLRPRSGSAFFRVSQIYLGKSAPSDSPESFQLDTSRLGPGDIHRASESIPIVFAPTRPGSHRATVYACDGQSCVEDSIEALAVP